MKPAHGMCLFVEAPDCEAVIDFAEAMASVTIKLVGGKLEIHVQASHGEGLSSFDVHDFSVTLPEQEKTKRRKRGR